MIKFIVDHNLDPRLKNRVKDIENLKNKVDVFVDKNRGLQFGLIEKHKKLSSLKYTDVKKGDTLYISGNKIIYTLFLKLLYWKIIKRVKLIYEIADLPLRNNKITNALIIFSYNIIVSLLMSKIIITSGGFRRMLWKKSYLIENINILVKKYNNFKNNNNRITIGFVGVIRYLEQQNFLIRYAKETPEINVVFHGGPNNLVDKLNKITIGENNITINGQFRQDQLESIYSSIDFIYANYDASQENVRLALPNKLYESIIFQKPIIVAENTYLSNKVNEYGCGFSVDSQHYPTFKKKMDLALKRNDYLFDYNIIVNKENSNINVLKGIFN